MNAKETAAALRAMADRLDACEVPGIQLNINMYHHNISDLPRLKFMASLMSHEPVQRQAKGDAWIRGCFCPGFDITTFYTPGLLGKTRKRKVVEVSTEVETDLSLLKD